MSRTKASIRCMNPGRPTSLRRMSARWRDTPPSRSRHSRAMSIATLCLWLACILVTATFLSLVEAIGSTGAFWLYAAMSVLNFLFIWRVMPETKGRSLEEIERSW